MIDASTEWNGKTVLDYIRKARLKSLGESALLVQGRAVSITPVNTGLLRSSITFVISGDVKDFPDAVLSGNKFTFGDNKSITAPEGTAIVGTVVFYAPYVEYGTRYNRAKPFLVPAYLDSLDDIKNIFAKNYKSVRWIK